MFTNTWCGRTKIFQRECEANLFLGEVQGDLNSHLPSVVVPEMLCTIYCLADMKRPPTSGRDLAEVETGAQMQPDRETHPVTEGEDSKGGGQMAGQEVDPGTGEPSPLFRRMSVVTSTVIFLYSAAFWIQVGVMPVSASKHACKGRVGAQLECKMKPNWFSIFAKRV